MSDATRYTVLRDTAEQKNHGWLFPASTVCVGTQPFNMPTGDYTLAGYENIFTIERKGSVSEFAQNITVKDKWRCFKEELERMEGFANPFIVLEFTVEQLLGYPEGCGLPRAVVKEIRTGGAFLLKRVLEIELRYKVKIIFAGTKGPEVASSLFKRIVELCPFSPPAIATRLTS